MSNVTSIAAHRVVVSWENTRWIWKRGVRQDDRLTDAAKILAAALCDDFAHHEIGACFPSIATLAESIAKSERSIQRAIAALRAAGWLDTLVRGRGDRRGTGNSKREQGSEFIFLMAGENPAACETDTQSDADQRATNVSPFKPKGDRQRVTPVTDSVAQIV